MSDLIRLSFAVINLPITLLFLLSLLYWASMILGFADHDSDGGDGHGEGHGEGHGDGLEGHGDGHLDGHGDGHGHVDGHGDGHGDGHADGHGDGHADGHADGDGHGETDGDDLHIGLVTGLLKFFHVGVVPLTTALSVIITCFWMVTMFSTWHFNPQLSPERAALLLFPDLIVAGLLSRLMLAPLVPLMRQMHGGVARRTVLIGRVGVVKTEEISSKVGQVEVLVDGASLLLNAKAKEGITLKKGEQVVIYSHDESRGIYEVTRM